MSRSTPLSIVAMALVAVSLGLVGACVQGGDGGSSRGSDSTTPAPQPQGTLRIFLTDAPADYDNVWVTITDVAVHKSGGRWQSLAMPRANADTDGDGEDDVIANRDGSLTVDLLALRGVEALIASGGLVPGKYTQIRLMVPHAEVVQDGRVLPARVPSGGTTGIKINGPITVYSGQVQNLALDWDVLKSLVPNPNAILIIPNINLQVPACHAVFVQDGAARGFGEDTIRDITIDAAGNIVAAGSSFTGQTWDVVVWRLKPGGTLDTTFNGQGWVTHGLVPGVLSSNLGESITMDDGGRILVSGSTHEIFPDLDLAVWRLLPDGQLDTSWGGQGWITHQSAAGGVATFDVGNGIDTDSAGRVVVGGQSNSLAGDPDMVVWRFNDDGSFDTSFGGTGFVVFRGFPVIDGPQAAKDVVVDASDRIVTTGGTWNGANTDMIVCRFLQDGTLDATFNGSGIFMHDNAAGGLNTDQGFAFHMDGSGRILVGGRSFGSSGQMDMAAWRIDPSAPGMLDTTFNGQGWVVHVNAAGANGPDQGHGIATDPLGRIVIAGLSANPLDFDMVVWRYTPSGQLDTTFAGGAGFGVNHNGAGGLSHDRGWSVAVSPLTGQIFVGGNSIGFTSTFDAVVWSCPP